jgi:hypothetical protein
MSVLVLVLLSMTPIAAMGILIGLGRFERYVLEGDEAGAVGLGSEVAAPAGAAAVGVPMVTASVGGVPAAVAAVNAQPVAHATPTAA